MNITGTMKIYRSEYEGKATFSTTISKKDQFGNYENMYISVQLPKNITFASNAQIEVTKGFLSFYKTKQGLPKLKIVVQEFEPIVEDKIPAHTDYMETPSYYASNDLPF